MPVIDELGYDLVDTAGVSMADTLFESFDHMASADQDDDGSDPFRAAMGTIISSHRDALVADHDESSVALPA